MSPRARLLAVAVALAAAIGCARRRDDSFQSGGPLPHDPAAVLGVLQQEYLYPQNIPTNAATFTTVDALLGSLNDPYTFEVTPQRAAQTTQGTFTGLYGITIAHLTTVFYVANIDPGGPAWAKGLRRNDVIRRIDGLTITDTTTDQDVQTALAVQTMTIDVTRPQPFTFTITRGDYVTQTVEEQVLDPDTTYLHLGRFASRSIDPNGPIGELDAALGRAGARRRVVLDLRWNGGGPVDQACAIADLFLAGGRVITIRDVHGNAAFSYDATSGHRGEGKTVVLLVNGSSASSSEIVASSIQGMGGAKVVGDRTYGKGVAQRVYDFPDGGQLYMVAFDIRDGLGRSWHATGIAPDVLAPLDPVKLVQGEDSQLTAAIQALGGTTAPSITSGGAPTSGTTGVPVLREELGRLR